MPPLPPVTDPACIKCSVRIADDASIDAGSRFFLSYTSAAPSSGDLATLATGVATAWSTDMAPYTNNNEHLVSVVCQDLSSDTGAEGSWTGSEAGSLDGDQLTSGVCVVFNHQISRKYRGGRPRTYLRCGDKSLLTGTNVWSADAQTELLSSWQAWIAAILATSGTGITLGNIVNISYFESFLPFKTPSGRYKNISQLRVGGPVVDSITGTVVAPKVGSQRRRLNV